MKPTAADANNSTDNNEDAVDEELSAPAPASTCHRFPRVSSTSVAGGPVTCLAFPSRHLCLWNQGSYLVRSAVQTGGKETDPTTASASASDANSEGIDHGAVHVDSRVLVFNDGDDNQLAAGLQSRRSSDSFSFSAANNLYGIRWPPLAGDGEEFEEEVDDDDDQIVDDGDGSCDKQRIGNGGSTGHSLVFGGRRLAWIAHALRRNRPMAVLPIVFDGVARKQRPSSSMAKEPSESVDSDTEKGGCDSSSCLVVLDWICDCRWERDGTLLIGLAHHTVLVYHVEHVVVGRRAAMRATPRASIPGPGATSIAYALAFSPVVGALAGQGVQVAAGSMHREITVWSLSSPPPPTTTNAYGDGVAGSYQLKDGVTSDDSHGKAQPLHQSLRGHQGAVHFLRFDAEGHRLVSASDDRTVRLWRRREADDVGGGHRWEAAWVAWGHAARCWSAAFCGISGERRVLVSTGEDGTARVWDENDGAALVVLRGHSGCQSVWRVDACGFWAVTGAHDGSLALHNLRQHLEGEGTGAAGSQFSEILRLPVSATDDVCSSKKVVVAMDFYQPIDASATLSLLVATRCGSMLRFNTVKREWTELSAPNNGHRSDGFESISSEITSLAVHPSGKFVAVGASDGSVALRLLSGFSTIVVLPKDNFGTVKRLEWVGPAKLVSYHVTFIVLWSLVQDEIAERGELPSTFCNVRTRPNSDGIPNCAALDASGERLVLGDTRGNLSLVPIPATYESQLHPQHVVAPSSVVRRAHSKEHVNHVLWKGCHRVFSAGNNGCICELAVRGDRITLMLSISLSPFTGLERLWNCHNSFQSTVVGGYYGNAFALKHFESGYELLRIETGGRQRNFCIYLHSVFNTTVSAAYFAVVVHKRGGGHDIQLTCRSVSSLLMHPSWSGKSITNSQGPSFRVGLGVHTETIYDAHLHYDAATQSQLLVTSSEDCSSRISLVRKGSIVASKLLPPQVSSVRAVHMCSGKSPGHSLLVVGGSKLTLQFFAVETTLDRPMNDLSGLAVRNLGSLTNAANGLQDHRINAVAAVSILPADGQSYLVASGDSNGECYLHLVTIDANQRHVLPRLVFRCDRPILSIAVTQTSRRILLLAGTSGGHLMIQDLSGTEADLNAQLRPKIDLGRPHSMGINSISVLTMSDVDDETELIRVCTGGDDQALYCCDVALSPISSVASSAPMTAKILCSALLTNACESAVRGLSWLGEAYVCATSYDQRLQVFKLMYPRLLCPTRRHILVGDVNCLSCLQTSKRNRDSFLVVVAGSGLHLISIVF